LGNRKTWQGNQTIHVISHALHAAQINALLTAGMPAEHALLQVGFLK